MSVYQAAIAVALSVPQHRARASKAYVPWDYIDALRAALIEENQLSPRLREWIERGADRLADGKAPEEFK